MNAIEIFKFTIMSGPSWFKARGTADIVFNADTYISSPLKHGGFSQKGDSTKSSLDIKLPLEDSLAQYYLSGSPSQLMGLTMFRWAVDNFYTHWKGRLVNYKVSRDEVTLHFESVFTSVRRPGLRARFSYDCRHVVYGPGCELDPEDFRDNFTCTAVNGVVLTVAGADALDDALYRGGMLSQPNGSKLFIRSKVGTQVTVNWPPTNTKEEVAENGSASVGLHPGCDLKDTTCDTVFNNLPNHGGFKHIPRRNAHGGNSIV